MENYRNQKYAARRVTINFMDGDCLKIQIKDDDVTQQKRAINQHWQMYQTFIRIGKRFFWKGGRKAKKSYLDDELKEVDLIKVQTNNRILLNKPQCI